MKNKFAILLLAAVSLFASAVQAAYLVESYQNNDSFADAQFIDSRYFDSRYDRDINTPAGVNISESTVHASVLATGDGTVDYFSFYALSGQAYFDIDYGIDFGGSFDPWIELYDASFTSLASNDDSFPIESGSFGGYDSFIDYNLMSDGLYYISVGSYPHLSNIPFGSNYTLQISQQAAVVPVPAAIWLFLSGALAIFGFASKRKSA